jgi:hypothetical protein
VLNLARRACACIADRPARLLSRLFKGGPARLHCPQRACSNPRRSWRCRSAATGDRYRYPIRPLCSIQPARSFPYFARNQTSESSNQKIRREVFATPRDETMERDLDLLSHRQAAGRAIHVIACGLAASLLSVFAVCMAPEPAEGEELASRRSAAVEKGTQCAVVVSPDQRLWVERWGAAGGCEGPTRTRVIDRFLGFVCLEDAAEKNSCRSFAPQLEDRALDASQFFHCVEMFVTNTEAAIVITGMRQWVKSGKPCDWSPSLQAPVTEVNFERGEVCTSGLCIPSDRLSIIGKLRLRQLVATAFRQLGVGIVERQWRSLPMRPVRISKAQGFFAAAPVPLDSEFRH